MTKILQLNYSLVHIAQMYMYTCTVHVLSYLHCLLLFVLSYQTINNTKSKRWYNMPGRAIFDIPVTISEHSTTVNTSTM